MSGLFVLLTFTLTLDPTLSLIQFNIPQLREMTRQGDTSLEFIMGVVMMNLPNQLLTRIQTNLTLRTRTGQGFLAPPGSFPSPSGSFPFSIPSQGGGGDNSNTPDPGVANNIDDEEPILLGGGRKKRSFRSFNSGDFHSSSFGEPVFGHTGNFHNTGGSYDGFKTTTEYGGSGKNYGHSGGYGNTHPGDQNGNLFGGNARGYIEYPGTGHGGGYHNPFPGHGGFGFNKENCPRQVDQGFVYRYGNDPMTYPA
ncbi:hypothetical protein PoB_004100100 [Plakobranchus ocellatus]|uniref:Uncharacterized protein n=1 Tax=Plakobranchus ocellatus TaxID=259542 RepID=A0AAV4B1V2_9GAST|nr:hypothetical protein PoB_004100100 [Plakobranchus ocellatus]